MVGNEAVARAMGVAILAVMTGLVAYTLLLDPTPRWSGEERRRDLWDGIFFLPFFAAVITVSWAALGPAALSIRQAPVAWAGCFVTWISLLGYGMGRLYHTRLPALQKVVLVLGVTLMVTAAAEAGISRSVLVGGHRPGAVPGWLT